MWITHAASCHASSRHGLSSEPVSVTENHHDGLASKPITHCQDFTLQASSEVKGLTGKPQWEIIVAAVWGQMSTGGGHSTLTETMAVLSIPVMIKVVLYQNWRMVGYALGGINEIS